MTYIVGKLHVEAVRALLQQASADASADDSVAGLMRAALIGNLGAVRAFLECGVPVNGVDSIGRTPLLEAVFGGHIDIVEELLSRGANANAQDHDGWTALMEASAKGRADVVRLLLARGADVRIKNKNGWTALRATAKCNMDVSRLLRRAFAQRN